jgi:hypothetical protein
MPIMGQIGTQQDQVSAAEGLDPVPHKSRALARLEVGKLEGLVVMPMVSLSIEAHPFLRRDDHLHVMQILRPVQQSE